MTRFRSQTCVIYFSLSSKHPAATGVAFVTKIRLTAGSGSGFSLQTKQTGNHHHEGREKREQMMVVTVYFDCCSWGYIFGCPSLHSPGAFLLLLIHVTWDDEIRRLREECVLLFLSAKNEEKRQGVSSDWLEKESTSWPKWWLLMKCFSVLFLMHTCASICDHFLFLLPLASSLFQCTKSLKSRQASCITHIQVKHIKWYMQC